MKKDQVIILKNRGVILISGNDAENFLQNIITNDIKKVTNSNSIFAALLTPQGKYLNEFFIIKHKDGFLLDCNESSTNNLRENLSKYKLRSKVEIKVVSSEYAIGIINSEKFKDLQIELDNEKNTIYFRETPIFLDPRTDELGARIFSKLENFYLTIKKLKLEIIDSSEYYKLAFKLGIPERGLSKLKEQLFALEANFENLHAIDFKKGCFVGQENTARMKLKNKVRKKLLPILCSDKLNVGDELTFNDIKVGKVLIDVPFAFALIKLVDPNLAEFENQELFADKKRCKLLKGIYES